ncbi:carbonic anhydrase/acetyltransferase-like protein (isoleucine patch superfamily) [Paenalcaligenes hominis]|uniref:Carbonic anhydrase/acetyltransferase-like protein (Isoleucine patch superfamily) n=1 Tax=Paenalcaligenes hominis TaxID=643674 RepID=A0ABX0WS17_9BURK|nr:gamma carbonic anhydrase family protein [Paenalcaligenes hominis]NJB65551.1 carbonic anhydrase/acetyltransferase-like protein (isoleucine patch superfamily) [Paenalcaligenes hominis]GGE64950.1 gamma carbonic anhydrase family protein [Paenalcaligenes hominis]
MTIYQFQNKKPTIADSAYVAPEAVVIGDVHLGQHTSVWPGAILRGDNEPIVLGDGSNAQEGAVFHTDPGYPLTVGKNVTIGHQAMLHGCTIEDNCLIGIQAVVLNGAVIGAESLVGAGALVTENKVFPPRSLILGSPAKAVRTLTEDDLAAMQKNAQTYIERGQAFKTGLVKLSD